MYSVNRIATDIYQTLLDDHKLPLQPQVREEQNRTELVNDGQMPAIPSPFKATEAIAAVKALEGSVAAALANVRFSDSVKPTVDVFQATLALSIHDVSEVEGSEPFVFGKKLATVPKWLRGTLAVDQ